LSNAVILLLDDEEDLLNLLKEALNQALPDFEIVSTTSFQEAQEQLQNIETSGVKLSMIIADHVLYDRTGLELFESTINRFPGVPSLMLTGQATPHVEERAKALGVEVLWKPVTLPLLLKTVRRSLAAHQ